MLATSTWASVTDYLLVVCLGSLVGMGELIARYRDAPIQAVLTVSAFVYTAVNGIASAAALILIRIFDWDFGHSGDAKRLIQVLVAGFGAMALFRSSLFIVRAGDQDVGVGPSSFLQVILAAADRSVDRVRAKGRATAVGDVMRNVSFAKALVALPAFCLALMQNVSAEDQNALGRDVDALRSVQMDERAKVLNLGLILMNLVGPHVLALAVQTLGDVIAADPAEQPPKDVMAAPQAGQPDLPPIPPMPEPAEPHTGTEPGEPGTRA